MAPPARGMSHGLACAGEPQWAMHEKYCRPGREPCRSRARGSSLSELAQGFDEGATAGEVPGEEGAGPGRKGSSHGRWIWERKREMLPGKQQRSLDFPRPSTSSSPSSPSSAIDQARARLVPRCRVVADLSVLASYLRCLLQTRPARTRIGTGPRLLATHTTVISSCHLTASRVNRHRHCYCAACVQCPRMSRRRRRYLSSSNCI